jgi:hypothetical protein
MLLQHVAEVLHRALAATGAAVEQRATDCKMVVRVDAEAREDPWERAVVLTNFDGALESLQEREESRRRGGRGGQRA